MSGYRRYGPTRNANRFDNYREITAVWSSEGACGHPIKAGDRIGYHRIHGARCAACWQAWKTENAEAEEYEGRFSGYEPTYDPHTEW